MFVLRRVLLFASAVFLFPGAAARAGLPGAAEIRDIAPPESRLADDPLSPWQWAMAAGAGFLVLWLLAAAVRRWKNSRRIPPHVAALRALNALRGDPIERIHRLSGILRNFLGARFHLPASGKTIDEIIAMLPKEILLGRRHRLEEFLREAENIRFSRCVPPRFAEDYAAYVRRFVESIKPEEPCD